MRLRAIVIGAGLLLAAAPQAAADGLPGLAFQGGAGVTAPGLHASYVAVPTRGGTLVERVQHRDGAVDEWRFLHGSFGVASAGYTGVNTGLASDGFRLVLAEISTRFPPRRTRLDVLDTMHMRVLERIRLPGFYTIDAISPDGRWLYLIHYTSRRNLLRYEVRAYDLAQQRLLRKPVVDPREPDEAMRGTAATRVESADGRWDYTLYVRPKGAPFIHALDTVRRTAACIDLPGVDVNDPSFAHLSLSGGKVLVGSEIKPQRLVDTRTFKVTSPAAPHPHPRRAGAPPKATGGGPPVWPAAVVAVALLAGAAGVRRRRATYAG